MFYSQDILQKRGGKFSKICDEILDYVLLRVQPRPDGKRPRFSLYLSALLMYGVVRIHQKQGEYLLEDVSTALVRMGSLVKISSAEDIDIRTETREDLVTNPEPEMTESQFQSDLDFLLLSDEELQVLLGRPDPEFWRMETSSTSSRSSVGRLSPQIVASPRREPELAPRGEPFQPVVGSPHQVTSREEITLQEPPTMPLVQEQVASMDLPLLDGTELDMRLGPTEEPALRAQDLLPTASTPAVEPKEKKRKPRRKQEKDKRTEEEEIRERTPERPPPDEIPEPRAVPPSPGVTLPIITSPLPRRQQINLDPLELVTETVSPARRGRKRQLGFADAVTQIPKALLKKNFTKTKDITEDFLLPTPKPLSAADLLAMPTGRDLKDARLLPLWTRNAKTQFSKQESETPEASSTSDVQSERAEVGPIQSPEFVAVPLATVEPQLSPVLPQPEVSGVERPSLIDESLEALRKATSMTGTAIIEDIEMPSVELPRDVSTSRVEPGDQHIDITLQELEDSARKDTSGRKRRKTRSAASTSLLLEPDLTGREPSVSRSLYDVQEEQEHRVPEASDIQPPEVILPAQVLEEVTADPALARQTLLQEVEADQLASGEIETTFRSICPPALTDRKTAATKFSALLDLCAQNVLTVHQPVAYGDINIAFVQDGNRQA